MTKPLVSIIIPVFNGATVAIAEEYAEKYSDRIRLFKKINGGVASALNIGIREMRGEYFSWLSHDDLYHPEKVAVEVDAVINGIIHGCALLIPRELIEKTGLLNESLMTTQDYDYWFRMFCSPEKRNLRHVPRALVFSRVHENQTSRTHLAHVSEQRAFWMIVAEEVDLDLAVRIWSAYAIVV